MSNLVSIIVPIYNAEKYLEKCILSIINQSYRNIEIILVNDGSLDNSGKICNEFARKDNRIKVIHQKNKGLSGARNSGLDIASGNYVTFVDSDDYLDNDAVEILIKNSIENGFVCYGIIIVKNKIEIKKSKKYYELSMEEFLKYYLIESASWGNWKKLDYFIGNSMNTKLFSIDIFKNLRFNINERISEDVDLMIDIILKSKSVKILPYAKYYYVHQNNESITSEAFNEKFLNLIEINKRIEEKIANLYPNYLQYAKMGTLFVCVYLINKFARLNNTDRYRFKEDITKILQEIYLRKDIIHKVGIIGKIKLWMIVYKFNLYIEFIRFIRLKLKL